MEKAPVPADTQYEYHFRASTRQASAEKNVVENQAQGFTLVESGDILGQHVVITQKASAFP
jgi:hypothetical protein